MDIRNTPIGQKVKHVAHRVAIAANGVVKHLNGDQNNGSDTLKPTLGKIPTGSELTVMLHFATLQRAGMAGLSVETVRAIISPDGAYELPESDARKMVAEVGTPDRIADSVQLFELYRALYARLEVSTLQDYTAALNGAIGLFARGADTSSDLRRGLSVVQAAIAGHKKAQKPGDTGDSQTLAVACEAEEAFETLIAASEKPGREQGQATQPNLARPRGRAPGQ